MTMSSSSTSTTTNTTAVKNDENMYQLIPYDVNNSSKEEEETTTTTTTTMNYISDSKMNDQQRNQLHIFHYSSIGLGIFIGFFIQFSTLGINFLIVTLYGEDSIVQHTKKDIFVCSFIWSFFTSMIAIIMLAFLRHLVIVTFNTIFLVRYGKKQQQQTTYSVDELANDYEHNVMLLEGVLLNMECPFVIGCLIGVCIAWTLTDMLLGMKVQIMFSLVISITALACCRLLINYVMNMNNMATSKDGAQGEDNNNIMKSDIRSTTTKDISKPLLIV